MNVFNVNFLCCQDQVWNEYDEGALWLRAKETRSKSGSDNSWTSNFTEPHYILLFIRPCPQHTQCLQVLYFMSSLPNINSWYTPTFNLCKLVQLSGSLLQCLRGKAEQELLVASSKRKWVLIHSPIWLCDYNEQNMHLISIVGDMHNELYVTSERKSLRLFFSLKCSGVAGYPWVECEISCLYSKFLLKFDSGKLTYILRTYTVFP